MSKISVQDFTNQAQKWASIERNDTPFDAEKTEKMRRELETEKGSIAFILNIARIASQFSDFPDSVKVPGNPGLNLVRSDGVWRMEGGYDVMKYAFEHHTMGEPSQKTALIAAFEALGCEYSVNAISKLGVLADWDLSFYRPYDLDSFQNILKEVIPSVPKHVLSASMATGRDIDQIIPSDFMNFPAKVFVSTLAKEGIPLDSVEGTSKEPPIFSQVRDNHVEFVQELLSRGANPNVTNSEGQTPIYVSVFKGNYDIFKNLVEMKADISGEYGFFNTTLMHAAVEDFDATGYTDRVKIVEALCDLGASAEAENSLYQTPKRILEEACERLLKEETFSAGVEEAADAINRLFDRQLAKAPGA